jgi:hypothetical protein
MSWVCVACLQVTAIFDSSLEVMISVWGETPSAGKVGGNTPTHPHN